MNICNPLVPNKKDILAKQYAKCLQTLRLDLPVKLTPFLKFLKELAISVREKAETAFQRKERVIKYPQVFYQAHILTTGLIDDIDDVMQVFESS
jgi:hypothetical protein